jgi:hypothetical protein
MAIVFPPAPAAGDKFIASNGITYTWNSTVSAWTTTGISGSGGSGGGTVTGVTASAPLASSGGNAPVISVAPGTANQLLVTNSAGTAAAFASNVTVPGTLTATGAATFSNIASLSAGSAGAPSLTFTGDVDTGLYSPGAGRISVANNGVNTVEVTATGDVLFGGTLPGSPIVSILPSLSVMVYKATVGTWSVGPNGSNDFPIVNQSNLGVNLINGSTSWTASSDERVKTDLIPIENGLEKVGSLRAFTGRYKKDEVGVSRSFLIAQDVLKVLPEAVDEGKDEDKTLGLRYTEVIPLLVSALHDAKSRIETLEAEVAALKAN